MEGSLAFRMNVDTYGYLYLGCGLVHQSMAKENVSYFGDGKLSFRVQSDSEIPLTFSFFLIGKAVPHAGPDHSGDKPLLLLVLMLSLLLDAFG